MKISLTKKILKSSSVFVFIAQKKWLKTDYKDLLSSDIIKDIDAKIKQKLFLGKEKEVLQILRALIAGLLSDEQ